MVDLRINHTIYSSLKSPCNYSCEMISYTFLFQNSHSILLTTLWAKNLGGFSWAVLVSYVATVWCWLGYRYTGSFLGWTSTMVYLHGCQSVLLMGIPLGLSTPVPTCGLSSMVVSGQSDIFLSFSLEQSVPREPGWVFSTHKSQSVPSTMLCGLNKSQSTITKRGHRLYWWKER